MKKILSYFLLAALLTGLCGCSVPAGSAVDTDGPASDTAQSGSGDVEHDHDIMLSDDGITVDGADAPGDGQSAVYTAHDVVYYESGHDFTYGEGTDGDEHDPQEAAAHTVVHITQPGTYRISGKLSAGQIAVDLGDKAAEDSSCVVTLLLDGADITCTVAPAIIFYRVYECGSDDTDSASRDVDLNGAGARLILAEDSINELHGSYVAKIYKSVTLSDDGKTVTDSKKLHKYDGAVYSKMSMTVSGGGTMNIYAENEGLDTELHLGISGGTVNIFSGNDGINTNEDGVSVTEISGGEVNVTVSGSTGEGDGIDSNGWLVIRGGTVRAFACSFSGDSGLDSDKGIFIDGGTVLATGNMYDEIRGTQNTAVFSFAQKQSGGEALTLRGDGFEETLTPENDYTCLVFSAPTLEAGDYELLCRGETLTVSSGSTGRPAMGSFGTAPQMPDGEKPGDEPPQMPDGAQPGGEPPQMPGENTQNGLQSGNLFTLSDGINIFSVH